MNQTQAGMIKRALEEAELARAEAGSLTAIVGDLIEVTNLLKERIQKLEEQIRGKTRLSLPDRR